MVLPNFNLALSRVHPFEIIFLKFEIDCVLLEKIGERMSPFLFLPFV